MALLGDHTRWTAPADEGLPARSPGWSSVQRCGDAVGRVGDTRPVGSEDLVGAAAYEVSGDLQTVTARTGDHGGDHGRGRGDHGGSHTAVAGAEETKVADAVTAKDSAVTVTEVRKDADSSYDVRGSKAGAHVEYDVTKDLTTVTARAPGAPGTAG